MNDWYQQVLTPPVVVEVNVRIGVIPSEDHAQALVEVKDPTTGVLLGQWSAPHSRLRDMQTLVDWMCAKTLGALEEFCEPF